MTNRRGRVLALIMLATAPACGDRSARPAPTPGAASADSAPAAGADATALTAVPVVGSLAIGAEVEGELAAGDPVLGARGTYAKAWTLAGRAGQSATIDLLGRDPPDQPGSFDPYLRLAGPGLDSVLSDDDGGRACDARLTVTFPADADYRVLVTTYRRAAGHFTLRVSGRPATFADEPCNPTPVDDNEVASATPRGRLVLGDSIPDDLASGQPAARGRRLLHERTVDGAAGTDVTVAVRSDRFDPELVIEGPGMGEQLYRGAEPATCVASLRLTLPKTGTYRLVVVGTTEQDGATSLGYVLSAGRGPPPAGCELLIVPGERVGPVTRATSEAELRVRFDVAEVEYDHGEGVSEPATALYPDDPGQRAVITWQDPAARTGPVLVVIRRDAAAWHSRRGVRIGTTLRTLERLNGRPFPVSGWAWDGAGTVGAWNGGDLTGDLGPGVWLVLDGDWDRLTPEERAQLEVGDRELPSDHPALRKLNPRVVEIRVRLRS